MLFDSIISLIRSAKKFIHIEIYLIGDGIFLRTLLSELILKAKEGIEVRFLYD
jgi:cardiolipin synthase